VMDKLWGSCIQLHSGALDHLLPGFMC
jgi:hypothetical protein